MTAVPGQLIHSLAFRQLSTRTEKNTMKKPLFTTAVALFATVALTTPSFIAPTPARAQATTAQTRPLPFDSIAGRGGIIRITPIIHGSIQIEYRGKVILVDPISAGTYRKKADVILITHPHGDHLDLPAIARTLKPNANRTAGGQVYAPASVLPAIRTIRGIKASSLNAGTTTSYQLPEGSRYNWFIQFQTVPMYNVVRGPRPGEKYHPKESRWNGYILTLGGKRIYIAGDTEATPEMKALKNIHAAFIPMNLPYTMTPQEAAVGVRAFRPR
ncbi:MAG TPA: MBL fold metallo-hydrolase, partial [Abditibacteriaceae bacterium]|nr:MBL fold metallo-hydrolase [Abditibacteriaceae bacterium]